MRRLITVVVAALFALALTVPAAAADDDPVALGILIAAHNSYLPVFEGGPDVLGAQKRGYQKLIDQLLGAKDQVAVWYYDEGGCHQIAKWTTDKRRAKAAIEGIQQAHGVPRAPAFYDAIKQALVSMELENLPDRVALVCMSDGKDRLLTQAQLLDRRFADITELSKNTRAKLLLLGLTLDVEAPLAQMTALAKRTRGDYKTVTYGQDAEIERALAGLAAELVKLRPPAPRVFLTADDSALLDAHFGHLEAMVGIMGDEAPDADACGTALLRYAESHKAFLDKLSGVKRKIADDPEMVEAWAARNAGRLRTLSAKMAILGESHPEVFANAKVAQAMSTYFSLTD